MPLERVLSPPREREHPPGVTTETVVEQVPLGGPTAPPAVPRRRRRTTTSGPRLTRGTVVGRYVIVDELGRGGMGTVYAAYDPDLDRRIALKVLEAASGSSSAGDNREPRFLREAQALARLSHENVIGVHDVGVFGKDVFIAMDLAPGRTLGHWLATTKRTRREIIDVMLAAGRGLAAAHAAGLVHRDFKPTNVIVGDDGRVRVLDFGLARATRTPSLEDTGSGDGGSGDGGSGSGSDTGDTGDDNDPELGVGSMSTPAALDAALATPTTSLLHQPITVAGSLLGTPAYMSPEQLQRQPATERSDQFGFAVVLHEALYGLHPFERGPRHEYKQRVCAGEIDQAPEGSNVPARLRRLLVRALAPDPEARFPSMDALLAELGRDPWLRWRRATVALAAVGFVVAMVFALAGRDGGAPALCRGAEDRLAGAWDAATRTRVRQAFVAAAGPLGEEAYVAAERVLADYTAGWVSMHTEACRATRVLGHQSEALLDLRTACLDRRLGSLRALTGTFAHADSLTVVTHAVEAAYALPRLEPCADAVTLRAAAPLPEDPAARARIDAARHVIDEARARLQAGDAAGSLALLEALGDGAQLDYAPAKAELLHVRGPAEASVPAAAEHAEAHFWAALAAAADAHADALAAEIWIALIDLIGHDQERPEDALAQRRGAELAIARAGHQPQHRADLLINLARLEWRRGRFEDARKLAEAALALHDELHGGEHPDVIGDLVLLGAILTDHGDYALAQPVHERALALRRKLLGPDHPHVADTLDNLGVVLYHEGRLDEAMAYYAQGLAVRELALGPTHADVGTSLNNLGVVHLDRGRLDEAESAFTRALAIWETAYGPDDATLAFALDNLGDVALARARWATARTYCARAQALEEPTVPADSPNLAYHLTCLGEAWLGEGKPARALPLLERASSLRGAGGGDPAELARTHFALAQALWDTGQNRAGALQLARASQDVFAAAGERSSARYRAASAWLAAHAR